MLEKIFSLLKKQNESAKGRVIRHLVLIARGIAYQAQKDNVEFSRAYEKAFERLKELISLQVELNIPIFTVDILPEYAQAKEYFMSAVAKLGEFLQWLSKAEFIHKNMVKVSFFGKWYRLPSEVVEIAKKIIEETKRYDSFFLNFCINYDGREEILDACKLIAKQVQIGKIDPEMINEQVFKENTYAGYFLPPDLIVRTGFLKKVNTLLWDLPDAEIYFSEKSFLHLNKDGLKKIIDEFKLRRY